MFASRQSIGIMGLGDSFVPSGPQPLDVQAAYQAGLVVGAGGTSTFDLSNSTAEEQAAFNAGYVAGSAPVTVAQTSGAPPGGTSSLPPPPASTPISNAVVFGVAGIAALFLIMAMVKR